MIGATEEAPELRATATTGNRRFRWMLAPEAQCLVFACRSQRGKTALGTGYLRISKVPSKHKWQHLDFDETLGMLRE